MTQSAPGERVPRPGYVQLNLTFRGAAYALRRAFRRTSSRQMYLARIFTD